MRWRRLSNIREWVPKLQSHRGFWVQGIQQNTLDSIQKAYELNYKMVEFDVRLTQDQQVVLFHDELISNQAVHQLTLVELKNEAHSKGIKISLLEEVLIWFDQQISSDKIFDFKLNIEIKSKYLINRQLESIVCKLIQKFNLQNYVLISSFNPLSLYYFAKQSPEIKRALLLTQSHESNFILNQMYLNYLAEPDLLHLRYEDFFNIKLKILSQNIPVVLWTVNKIEDLQKYKDQIQGIISDSITPYEFDQIGN